MYDIAPRQPDGQLVLISSFQTGRRSDSAHAYIHATRAKHSNLYLACNTKIDKVIMENGRAVAVQTL